MLRETPCDILVKQIKEENSNCHIFKIENFSLLKKYHIKQVESSVFTFFGRKWKLILYPDGNEKENGKGHVSLYLEFQDSGQIVVYFHFFVLNQLKINMSSQEGVMEFNKTNNKYGAAKLMSIDILNDSKEGYLMGDCSIFGVTFHGYPVTEPATAETFSLIEYHPPRNRVTWKMEKFSAFNPETDHMSHEFTFGNRKWRLQVFPRGDLNAKGKYLSVNLLATGFMDNTPKTKTYAKYALRVLNQKDGGVHRIKAASHWFSEEECRFGWSEFMTFRDLNWGYLEDNKLRVGVEMAVVSTAKYS